MATLADLYVQLGRRQDARDRYQRALDARPDDAVSHHNLAVVLYHQGEIPLARHHADRALALGGRVRPGFLAALREASGGPNRLPSAR